MKTEIENAIKILTARITPEVKYDDALRFTQAALNLAHTLQVYTSVELSI